MCTRSGDAEPVRVRAGCVGVRASKVCAGGAGGRGTARGGRGGARAGGRERGAARGRRARREGREERGKEGKEENKKNGKRKRKEGEREKGKKREGERFAPKTRRSVGHARRRAHVSTMRGSRKNRAVDLVVGVGSNRDREIGRNRECSRNIRVRL